MKLVLAVLAMCLVGCGPTAVVIKGIDKERENAKLGTNCPFCGEFFPHGEIMGHKITCTKNKQDMKFKK